VDKLDIATLDIQTLQLYADFNQSMNAYVLRIVFVGRSKVTIQIFVSRKTAMCFSSNLSTAMFNYLFRLLNCKYGINVFQCTLCTTVWTYSFMSRIGDLGLFYAYIQANQSNLEIEFNPEIFPCLTLVVKHFHHQNTYVRIFHTGKVVLLGVKCTEQVVSAVEFLSNMFFDYSLSCNLNNFL
jgi:TATA-box binding protein (TBP) (component of TFIID and TFIIIB)